MAEVEVRLINSLLNDCFGPIIAVLAIFGCLNLSFTLDGWYNVAQKWPMYCFCFINVDPVYSCITDSVENDTQNVTLSVIDTYATSVCNVCKSG